jgi:hypothetical protein
VYFIAIALRPLSVVDDDAEPNAEPNKPATEPNAEPIIVFEPTIRTASAPNLAASFFSLYTFFESIKISAISIYGFLGNEVEYTSISYESVGGKHFCCVSIYLKDTLKNKNKLATKAKSFFSFFILIGYFQNRQKK